MTPFRPILALAFMLLTTPTIADEKTGSPEEPLTTRTTAIACRAQGWKTAGNIAVTMAKFRDEGK